jgi:hypothetical protein
MGSIEVNTFFLVIVDNNCPKLIVELILYKLFSLQLS